MNEKERKKKESRWKDKLNLQKEISNSLGIGM